MKQFLYLTTFLLVGASQLIAMQPTPKPAAKPQHTAAMNLIHRAHATADQNEKIKLLRNAERQLLFDALHEEDPIAQLYLGSAFLEEAAATANINKKLNLLAEAQRWLKPLVQERKSKTAAQILGIAYLTEAKTTQDTIRIISAIQSAYPLLAPLAQQGNLVAQAGIGDIFALQANITTENIDESTRLLEEALRWYTNVSKVTDPEHATLVKNTQGMIEKINKELASRQEGEESESEEEPSVEEMEIEQQQS